MRNIVIGTAGHIDHGKTTLIKYLTGQDTDTLPEEKKRGITIDLGFAYLDISENRKIGIIDVPGHEKFIKNMAAGVVGIDYIILVVACDDGVMPQTEEHFNIASLFGVKHGVIILTKTDLADELQKERVKKEIKNLVKNSFLEKAEILETSVKDKNSYNSVKEFIKKDIEKIHIEEAENKDFRMYVDRCFSMKGFGTVVTGTALQGKISRGDTVNIYPSGLKARIKKIENHGTEKETIETGNRCALNLAGIEKDEIGRGDIISSAPHFLSSKIIDVMFELLKGYSVKNNQKIRVHLGTREITGKIKIFKNDIISNEGRYPAQLYLDEETAGIYGELGIIRNYSPMKTIGGVKILNVLGKKVKKTDSEYIKKLESLDKKEKVFENLEKSSEKKELLLKEILKKFHLENPFERGVLRAELKNKYFNDMSHKEFKNFIDESIINSSIKSEKIFEKEYISLKSFKIKLTKNQKELKEEIFKKYKNCGFIPEKKSIIEGSISINETNDFETVHNFLYEEKMIILLKEDYYILRGFLKEAEKRAREYFIQNEKLTIKNFRELLNINRKSALLILEKFDELGITKRKDDYRILK